MKKLLVAGVLILMFIGTEVLTGGLTEVFTKGPVSQEEAYQLIETLVIEGKFGGYRNVPVNEDNKKKEKLAFSLLPINDKPFDPSLLNHNPQKTSYKIWVKDSRGRALFGFMGGGGWKITGGLVDFVHNNGTRVELFAVQALKLYNGFFDNYFLYKEMVYEFYLVVRGTDSKGASIIKKWTIGHDEIIFSPYEQTVKSLQQSVDQGTISKRDMEKILNDPANRHENIEGYLNYFRDTKRVEVVIKGLKEGFQERIQIK